MFNRIKNKIILLPWHTQIIDLQFSGNKDLHVSWNKSVNTSTVFTDDQQTYLN